MAAVVKSKDVAYDSMIKHLIDYHRIIGVSRRMFRFFLIFYPKNVRMYFQSWPKGCIFLEVPMLSIILKVLLVILIIAAVLLAVAYFAGTKMQARQLESQKMLEAAAQIVPILVIDKKKMRLKEAPLPEEVIKQAPAYSRFMKIGVVKAKVGPRVLTMICDDKVFKHLPEKVSCKVKCSGIYITDIVKGAVYSDKEIEKHKKEKEKAEKKAAKN